MVVMGWRSSISFPLVHRAQQRQLGLRPHVLPRGRDRVARRQLARGAELAGAGPGGTARDRRRRLRGEAQALGGQLLGEAVAGLVALHHPHADAEVHLGEGAVHCAVLEDIGVADAVLEEDVGEVAPAREGLAERVADERLGDPEAGEVADPETGSPPGRGEGRGRPGEHVVKGDRPEGGGADPQRAPPRQ
jgi:hypothetical protein